MIGNIKNKTTQNKIIFFHIYSLTITLQTSFNILYIVQSTCFDRLSPLSVYYQKFSKNTRPHCGDVYSVNLKRSDSKASQYSSQINK